MNSLFRVSACLLSTLGLVSAAAAQEVPYFYGGQSFGGSWADIDERRMGRTQVPSSWLITEDERAFAFKVFLGYQFSPYLAIEGGYFHLGEFSFVTGTTPAGTLDATFKAQGANVDLVGTLPLSSRWSALARAGAHYAESRAEFVGSGSAAAAGGRFDEEQINAKFGVGLQYEINSAFRVRAEVERYVVDDALNNRGYVDTGLLTFIFPFGRAPEPPPPPPEPVAVATPPPAPPPAPVVTPPPAPPPPPPPPPRRRVSFETDSLFGFDQAVIRPQAREKLDAFAAELKETRFDVVTVEGHTDRLGAEAYNERLSIRRAEAVRDYLIGAGVDSAKISAVGKGESTPVTQPDQCKGTQRTPQLIACLQPDRRVEVEVVGTQPPLPAR